MAEQLDEMGKGIKKWIAAVFNRGGGIGKGLLWTGLYLILIFFFRGFDAWKFLWEKDFNEVGDFLAGVFTPVAFGWLIYGYFLQREEFRLQRQELHEMRNTLGKQVEVTARQAKVTEREAEAAIRQYMPNLSLREIDRKGGPHGKTRRFALRNFGRPASDLEITLSDASGREVVKKNFPLLEQGEPQRVSTPVLTDFGPEGHFFHCGVLFLSKRQDRFYQGWAIELPDETSAAKIHEEPLPMLLVPGQSPPEMFWQAGEMDE